MVSRRARYINFLVITVLVCILSGCGSVTSEDEKILILTSTSIIADIVKQVGGEFVTVSSLIPIGADPHDFSPQPKEAAAISEADIIFLNGAGLEENLLPVIENSGGTDKVVEVSRGIDILVTEDRVKGTSFPDPHTWMDPNNILIWLENITVTLAGIDPGHSEEYHAKSTEYSQEITELDMWVRNQIEIIPAAERLIVSDHNVLGYFNSAYGFTQIGTITGSSSTEASPSAQDIARLEDLIKQHDIPAIFISETSSTTLVDQIAVDTGIQVVHIFHGSLTTEEGPAPIYLKFIRYNVTAIVEALK